MADYNDLTPNVEDSPRLAYFQVLNLFEKLPVLSLGLGFGVLRLPESQEYAEQRLLGCLFSGFGAIMFPTCGVQAGQAQKTCSFRTLLYKAYMRP